MPHIQLDDTQISLPVGELRVGRGSEVDVRIDGRDGGAGNETAGSSTLAVIRLSKTTGATIQRSTPDAMVTVNGVALGGEPSPLIHGDRIDVAGRVLRYADDAHSGSTQIHPRFTAQDRYEVSAPSSVVAGREERGSYSGGRLISLVDGREYGVSAAGLRIGRDAGADVVVPAGSVSRRHAEIVLTSDGYVLSDLSANGVEVNGGRVATSHVLVSGDVLRIGGEEFRFHADPPPAEPQREVKDVASGRSAAVDEAHTTAGSASLVTSGTRAADVLATLEIVNEGVLRGTRFDVHSPLTYLGRGPHNDIVVADESISDSHAKLQKRESGWFVVDMDSTNGTYVAGQRIVGEGPIGSADDVRLGGVKMKFRTAAAAGGIGAGTRVIVGVRGADPSRAERVSATPPPTDGAVETEMQPRSIPVAVWVAAFLLLASTILFLLQGR